MTPDPYMEFAKRMTASMRRSTSTTGFMLLSFDPSLAGTVSEVCWTVPA
jgi:hypothetical protein